MVFQRETSAFVDAQEYLFKHALLREVAYESVLKRLRRVYHGLVADWLLEQSGERLEEYTGLIADHLALAGRTEAAVEYLLQAGDRARGLYAHQEAIRAYERALALLKTQGDNQRAARTLMKLGLAHHHAFAFHRARQAYEEGFALWQRAAKARPATALPPAPHALREKWYRVHTLDAALTDHGPSIHVIQNLFCGLVELSPEMDVIPDIAQSWEVLENGHRYIFHLRDDAIWSDGVPVTARDFEVAWKRVLDPVTGSPWASLLYDVVGARAFNEGQGLASGVGVKAADEGTLIVELERPAAYFLQLLARGGAFPVPQHAVEAHGQAWTEPGKIVTNGPFRLALWQPGESLVLVRNPAYHGQFSGNLGRVELTPLTNDITLVPLQMYEAGSLDLLALQSIPPAEWDRARRGHDNEIVSAPILRTRNVSFFASGPPLDDIRVRQALVLATDQETLADVIMGGYDFPATGGVVPPGMPGHSPGIGLLYDPERARQLLAEAGYAGGRGFPPVEAFTWVPGSETISKHLQAQWRESLGVEIPWQMVDLVAHERERRAGRREQPHLWLTGWLADYPDPDNFLRVAIHDLRHRWGSMAYERLVEEARRVGDQAERMVLYRHADRMLIEEAVVMPLTYGRSSLLVKPWVTRYPLGPMGDRHWKDVILEPH
jgi:ABC-type oligopeptide transport system substrate-binding subunit